MARVFPKNMNGFNPFGDYIGLTFTRAEKGHSHCVLEMQENLSNPHRAIQGGATFSMADSGMGTGLLTCISEDELCSNIETKIVCFKAVASGTIVCDTRVIHQSKRVATLESEVKQNKELVAKAIGTLSIYKVNKGE